MQTADRTTADNAEPQGQSPYEAALTAALIELSEARDRRDTFRREVEAADARVDELTDLVRKLLTVLPPQRAAKYEVQLDDLRLRPTPSTRVGPVHDNVVELFTRTKQREWSASEVQAALAEEGRKANPKAVYNVLDYLVRRGNLKRAGRGRYLIVDLGIGIELGDDIRGEDQNGGCT